ncbi:hypothetical protein MMC07_008642 [Pseudocyphellaria aurata]|nr:hypothetical protein [Pseudocyphellaria aurata]
MKFNMGKAWRAMHCRGKGHMVPDEQPVAKPSHHRRIIKRLFKAGKKSQVVHETLYDSVHSHERVCQNELSGESANTPTITTIAKGQASGSPSNSGNLVQTQYNGPIESVPDQIELSNDEGVSVHEYGPFMEETRATSNILTELETPISSIWERPTVRRAVSEGNLGRNTRRVFSESNLGPARDVPAGTSGDSDGQSGSNINTTLETQQLVLPEHATAESREAIGLRSEGHEAGCADCARTIVENDNTWNLVVKARKRQYRDDLDDLQYSHGVEMKALKTAHRREILTLKSKNLALQKKVQELQSGQAILEANLEAKETTMQQVIGASQTLQESFDSWKARCDRGPMESDRIDPRIHHQQLPTSHPDWNDTQAELENSRHANQTLSKGLADTQVLAATFEQRLREMSDVDRSKTSTAVAEMGVSEAEDHRYQTLAFRAGQCLTALTESEKERAREKEIAAGEIAFLKAELVKKEATISHVSRSRNKFQHKCADVLAMLHFRVFKDDLITAMEACFQTAMDDNSFLKTEVERLDSEISSRDLSIRSLKTAVDGAKISLDAKTNAADELVRALSTKETELGALQMELDSLKSELQDAIKEKDKRLADTDERIQTARESVLALMEMDRDERETNFLRSKDDQIAALEQRCGELARALENCELHYRLQSELSAENAGQALLRTEELKDAQAQLQAAEAQIQAQQNQFRGRMGLPTSISMSTVLEMKKELGDARLRIQELEGDD